MKEFLFQIKKKWRAGSRKLLRKTRRLFVRTSLTEKESYTIPIVLNNRNRFSYLKQLVDWLTAAGYTNIFILDNASDYPELLDYYKQTPAKVVYLERNAGYKALWQSDLFNEIRNGYYVYSDSDLMPGANCPKNLLYRLYQVLEKYPVEKCGPALRINDLPDHYERRQEVIAQESKHWNKLEENVYDAPIDTTFALYKPFAYGDAEELKACRVGGDLEFIHLPWYEDSKNLTKEAEYYKKNATSSSYWYTKK